MKLLEMIKHDKAPFWVILFLTVMNAGFALGLPGEIGGVLTIIGAAFLVFRNMLK